MPDPKFTFTVNTRSIFPESTEGIAARSLLEGQLSPRVLKSFLASVVDGKIGLAPTYDEQQKLRSIAFASPTQVLIVVFSAKGHTAKCELLKSTIFMDSSLRKYAFHMDKLCTSLFLDFSLRMNKGIDILSNSPARRHLLLTKVLVLGGEPKVDKEGVIQLFREDESSTTGQSVVATQAWAALQAASAHNLGSMPCTIDTTIYSTEELNFIAKTIRDAELLKGLKPISVKNEIEDQYEAGQDKLTVQSSRYKTRIMRPGSNQVLRIEMTRDGQTSNFAGRLAKLQGRMAQLDISNAERAEKLSICTVGREDPTAAEALRTNILLRVVQDAETFLTLPFVEDIWFPKKIEEPTTDPSSSLVPINFDSLQLNKSQKSAVEAILSDKPSKRVVLIQGPPGTGKTTVIVAAVVSTIASQGNSQNVWLVAQSNVAVKNIAEKLAKVGFFYFKLLVSKDFHFDWHEHLYTAIEENVIRSDDFVDSPLAAERLLKGSRVILCTLSMLSNDRIAVFTRVVPPKLFIFDEASQIEVGDYVPILHRYQKTMCKLVFIGDDKQLPPYGQSDIDDLQSVFELPHLRQRALFLDTQYRMPVPIGNFISKQVYYNRLKTEHPIKTRLCCRFVDVSSGREISRGHSWINEDQAHIAVAIARKMQALHHSYRIITPYDAQRSLVEARLKRGGLDWENKVFNVDSFQGNEDDYIIISLVRTSRVGFLRELRRVNVMLTRCRKGMIICTDREFVEGVAPHSLVAELAKALGNDVWVPWKSVLQPGYRPFSA